uniref:Galectin n=1 Tax=Salvator merianae TaxID=96440 RepID=A0A8D0BCC3_SALMN
ACGQLSTCPAQIRTGNGLGCCRDGTTDYSNGDIAFHFNPRFDEARRVVVCNTQQKGHWGTEERTAHMPFQPNNFFEITINVKSYCYQVMLQWSNLTLFEPPQIQEIFDGSCHEPHGFPFRLLEGESGDTDFG